MEKTVRFWGAVTAVKPRLTLTKFEGVTTAKSAGYLLVVEGSFTPENEWMGKADSNRSTVGRFTVALGPATMSRREIGVGDLIRGDAYPVPEGNPDTPADLYRVGVLRILARAGDPGTPPISLPDSPRTDSPLSPEQSEVAPRRALRPENLAEDGSCQLCPHGIIVPVVRLSDPRDYRGGVWRKVPACLGPEDCPHFIGLI